MTKDDGGLAFPHHEVWDAEQIDIGWIGGGMTLRDWFAGQALAGLAGQQREFMLWMNNVAKDKGISPDEQMAGMAYVAADAMLAERDKP